MSNTNGTNSFNRSLNGIITYDDGAGTLIQNGSIITNNFTTNTFTANDFNAINAIISGSIKCNIIDGLTDLTQTNICTLFNNEVNGIIYIGCANTSFIYIGYNTNIYKVLYLGSHASDIFLGGFKFLNNDMNMADDMQDMNIANTQYTGNLNIGTYVNRSGQIKIGNISNTNIIGDIKIISNAINLDINADFIIGDELLNFNTLYLGNLVNRNVIGGCLIINNDIDLNVVGTLTIGSTNATNIKIGNATTINTLIQNSDTFVIGNNAMSWSIYGLLGQGVAFMPNIISGMMMAFYSSSLGTVADAYISVTGGTSSATQGNMVIAANDITIQQSGNLKMGSSTSTTTYIRNTTNLIIGANPSTYAVVGNTLAGNGASIYTKDNYSIFDMYSSGNTGQNNTSSRIYSYGGTSAVNSGALTLSSGSINITPVGNTNIGTSTTILNTIRSSNGLIIGQDPTTYSYSTGYMTGNGMRFSTDSNVNLIDFHTSTLTGQQDFTSRIRVDSGTTQNTGDLTISAGTIAITPVNNLTLGTNTNLNRIGKLNISGNAFDTAVMLDDLNIGISNAGKLNIGGQSSTVFGGQTRITGALIDLASAGTLTIGSANTTLLNVGVSGAVALNAPSILIGSTSTTTAIIIGNASINPVKIQTSDRIVMGINPSSYNTSTGTLSGAGVIVGTNGTGPYNAFVDFYSYAGTTQGNSARIMSNSGGLTISNYVPSKPFNITSSQNINLSPAAGNGVNVQNGGLYLYAGLAYGKGNLTSPHFTQTYSSGMIGPAISGNSPSPTSLSYTFTTPFGNIPTVTLSHQITTGTNTNNWGIILSVAGVSSTGVVFVAYNAKNTAVAVNSWGYNIIAVGGW